MRALLKFYLEKSWLPLLAVALLTLLLGAFHPTFEKFDILLIVAALWFLLRWNHSEEKMAEESFMTTIAPDRLHLLLVQFMVPALILTVPFVVCIWTTEIYSWDWQRMAQAFMLSASLSALSMRFTKPKRAIVAAVLLYLAMSSEDISFIPLLLLFILMSYLAVQQVYGQRLARWKLRTAAIAAAIAVIFIGSNGAKIDFSNLKIINSSSNSSFNYSFSNSSRGKSGGTPGGRIAGKTAGKGSEKNDGNNTINYRLHSVAKPMSLSDEQLGDTAGLLQSFEEFSFDEKNAMIEELIDKEHVPSAVLIAGLENKVFAMSADDRDAASDPCDELCDRLASYAGRYYDTYSNEDMKARYKTWLHGDEKMQQNYVQTLAVLTKMHRHKDKLTNIVEGEAGNVMGKFRDILKEVSDGSRTLDGLVNEEPEALQHFAEVELHLSERAATPAN